MKAASLKGDLLMRKGAAAPVPGVEVCHRDSVTHPLLTALGDAERAPAPAKARPPGRTVAEPKRDRFGRVRVSLRLDRHRHLRLKLLAAHNCMSLQETLIAALDAYLDDEARGANDGNCDCLQGPAQGREAAAGARSRERE